jgi:hypothetical protein
MHVQVGGHGPVDRVEELAELDGPMPAMQLADDLPALGIQGREQRRGTVPDIVMAAPLYLAGALSQPGPGKP